MPTFRYDARDKKGNTVSGYIDALEARSAAAALREQGLFPSRIEQTGGGKGTVVAPPVTVAAPPSAAGTGNPLDSIGLGNVNPSLPASSATYPQQPVGAQTKTDIAPFLVSVPLPALAMMFRQMATLMDAGVPMVQAISTLSDQTQNPRLKRILRECAMAVASGQTLSTVMVRYPSVFTSLQVELIRAGEQSGMMDMMCNRLADYIEREIEIRRKLKRETLYPKIVLFVAWLVLGLFAFLKGGGTGGVLGYLSSSFLFLAATFGVWWLARYLNQYPAVGQAWDNVKMLIPGPGGVARKYATARFTRALGTLYAGGVLLPRAVEISARACGNRAIGQAMLSHVGALHQGEGISGMLARSGMLSPIAVQMARTGEQTGNLDTMMSKVSDYLESEADAKAHQLAVFAGVGALIIAAIVVAVIVISFYVGQITGIMNEAGK